MVIRFECNHCNKKLGIADTEAGKWIKCPGCGGKVRIPLSAGGGAAVTKKPAPAAKPPPKPPPPAKRRPAKRRGRPDRRRAATASGQGQETRPPLRGRGRGRRRRRGAAPPLAPRQGPPRRGRGRRRGRLGRGRRREGEGCFFAQPHPWDREHCRWRRRSRVRVALRAAPGARRRHPEMGRGRPGALDVPRRHVLPRQGLTCCPGRRRVPLRWASEQTSARTVVQRRQGVAPKSHQSNPPCGGEQHPVGKNLGRSSHSLSS